MPDYIARRPPKKSPCDCGSGLRYERCCRPADKARDALLREVTAKYAQDGRDRAEFTKRYGEVRRPVGVEMDGGNYVIVDGEIWHQPGNFIDFLHSYALNFFGNERLLLEEAVHPDLRHPALQWMYAFTESQPAVRDVDGNGASWIRFAHDLYTIRDNSTLTVELRRRLLEGGSFQGARYELKISALCAAAGFDLEFEDETANARKHPEFIGIDRASGARIAVEAKSRQRKGVLSFTGGKDATPGSSVGARGVLLDAYAKQPDAPYYVFVDVNLPCGSEEAMIMWESELKQLIHDLTTEGYHDPCPANAVFFTNDPSHYAGSRVIGAEEDMLWCRAYTFPNPRFPHPSPDMVDRLMKAHLQRVAPPERFSEAP